MIELDDPRWEGLTGGYRLLYDPRPALRALEADANRKDLWDELWNELHHQGDLGEASYAAVVALVRIESGRRRFGSNLFALAATIEVERHRKGNPPIPAWLELGCHVARARIRVGRRESRTDAIQKAVGIASIVNQIAANAANPSERADPVHACAASARAALYLPR